MVEHRLIERMLKIIKIKRMELFETGSADSAFIASAVDFIKMYADRTHHGKEEDILFKRLAGIQMDEKDQKVMVELVQDHEYSRQLVNELATANRKYIEGDQSYLKVILEKLDGLAEFYPVHIQKEDYAFFPRAEDYLDPKGREEIVGEFLKFDQRMIHEKYRLMVDGLEGDGG
jgi:hemerythrin-like domain-containing protein